jgi:hypothetical protein
LQNDRKWIGATQTLTPDDGGDSREKIKELPAEIVAPEKQPESIEEQARELVAAAILRPKPKNE